jgi:hypothetical protein
MCEFQVGQPIHSYSHNFVLIDVKFLTLAEKIATPVRVEAKVWFANERTWISYLSTAILTSTLSLALWNASDDIIGKWFALVYAVM